MSKIFGVLDIGFTDTLELLVLDPVTELFQKKRSSHRTQRKQEKRLQRVITSAQPMRARLKGRDGGLEGGE